MLRKNLMSKVEGKKSTMVQSKGSYCGAQKQSSLVSQTAAKLASVPSRSCSERM